MKYLRRIFENLSPQERQEIVFICKKYDIKEYTINEDGSIDVYDDSVRLTNLGLTKLPLKFRKVNNFKCDRNQLTSLEGAPQIVSGYFDCSRNQLTSLEGGPETVGESFGCSGNQLTSLEGGPKSVGGNYICQTSSGEKGKLMSFLGIGTIGKDFTCIITNPIFEIWELFKDKDKLELFNYMDPTYLDEDGNPCCSLTILNAFLKEIGKEPVTTLKNFKCVE